MYNNILDVKGLKVGQVKIEEGSNRMYSSYM